jgi:hypothetical protein
MQKTARLARLQTWQPTGRIQRILKTRLIPFTGDPAALISNAAQLVPQRGPIDVMLYIGRRTRKRDSFPALSIGFGTDARGIETFVWIALEDSDVPMMALYTITHGKGQAAGMIRCDFDGDDDGNEEMAGPPLRLEELAQLPTTTIAL